MRRRQLPSRRRASMRSSFCCGFARSRSIQRRSVRLGVLSRLVECRDFLQTVLQKSTQSSFVSCTESTERSDATCNAWGNEQGSMAAVGRPAANGQGGKWLRNPSRFLKLSSCININIEDGDAGNCGRALWRETFAGRLRPITSRNAWRMSGSSMTAIGRLASSVRGGAILRIGVASKKSRRGSSGVGPVRFVACRDRCLDGNGSRELKQRCRYQGGSFVRD